MKTAFTILTAVATMLALAGAASAQTSAASPESSGYVAVGAYPYYYPGYGYHSSTYEEGVLRGMAAVARARGEANYWHSLAAINRQEAYARYVRNRELATAAYFQMRQYNRAARDAERPQRLSQEQYVALAKMQAPDRLSEAQYDRAIGRLAWPAVLEGEEFAAEREAIAQAYQARLPTDAGAGTAFHTRVRQLSEPMRERLIAKIDQLTPAEFMAAKKFIDSLGYEAQQPLVAGALASVDR